MKCLFVVCFLVASALAAGPRRFSIKKDQINLRYACEDHDVQLRCPAGHMISVRSGFYGVDDVAACGMDPDWLFIPPCGDYVNTLKAVMEKCEGHGYCSVSARDMHDLVQLDCNNDTRRYLAVHYQCELLPGYCRDGTPQLPGCDDVCAGITCAQNPDSVCVPNKCNKEIGCYAEFRHRFSGRWLPCNYALDVNYDPPKQLNLTDGVYLPHMPHQHIPIPPQPVDEMEYVLNDIVEDTMNDTVMMNEIMDVMDATDMNDTMVHDNTYPVFNDTDPIDNMDLPAEQLEPLAEDEPISYDQCVSAVNTGFGDGEYLILEPAMTLDECIDVAKRLLVTEGNAVALRLPTIATDKGPFDCFLKINQTQGIDDMNFINCLI